MGSEHNVLHNKARTNGISYLDPKGEVSIMKLVKVLCSRSYSMKRVARSRVTSLCYLTIFTWLPAKPVK